jgi:hypothetical protein
VTRQRHRGQRAGTARAAHRAVSSVAEHPPQKNRTRRISPPTLLRARQQALHTGSSPDRGRGVAGHVPQTREARLITLLKPYPADEMTVTEVGPAVNSPKHDGPECLDAA